MTGCPGVVIAAPTSGQGKTIVTLGLLRALRRQGLSVASAKVGPDYIDPAFHAAAGNGLCLNLDPWAMTEPRLHGYAAALKEDAELIVCEGVMGLFDGATVHEGSTANLASAMGWPIVLVVSGQSVGASAAAIVRGFASHRAGIDIAGVIFNKVGSDRHAAILQDAMQDALPEIPVLGAVRRGQGLSVPERHLGLVQAGEQDDLDRLLNQAADAIDQSVDLGRLRRLARPAVSVPQISASPSMPPLGQTIAVARDQAFGFCYPHLLTDWARAGVTIRLFSPLANESPPEDADAVYLPGGYPELHGPELAGADRFLAGLRRAAEAGKPVFGECGGYMVLGEAIIDAQGTSHPMAGLLPLVTSFQNRKLHLGYRRAILSGDAPFGSAGSRFRAHEFHYATILSEDAGTPLFDVADANGDDLGPVGRRSGSVMGSFMHLIAAEE